MDPAIGWAVMVVNLSAPRVSRSQQRSMLSGHKFKYRRSLTGFRPKHKATRA
jgi:hypothetical protein